MKDVGSEIVVVDAQREDSAGVEDAAHLGAHHLEGGEDAHGFYPTSSATGTSAHDAHQDEANPGEVWPEHEVFCGESRGAHHGCDIEERFAEAMFGRISRMPPLTQGAGGGEKENEGDEQSQFLVFP